MAKIHFERFLGVFFAFDMPRTEILAEKMTSVFSPLAISEVNFNVPTQAN